jgi:hypothetical protein
MADTQHTAPGPRHLSFESLDTYWAARVPVEVPVLGQPICRLQLDPRHGELRLLTPFVGAEPNVSRLRNIELNTFVEDDEDWAEVRIKVAGSPHGAYSILTGIADRLQLEGEQLAVAVPRAIAEHRGLLAGRVGLSEDQEIGLYGELLLLDSLLVLDGKRRAVGAWTGPLSEEHDFAFDDVHVEVKTTTAERRRHLIGGLQQLKPVRDFPLWLLSIQITRSGTAGRTLTDLVQDVRAHAGDVVVDVDDRLAAAGWEDDAGDLFRTVWALRSTPRCYRVDDSFPALTEDRLAQVVPRASLVSDVSYRVDVTDLDCAVGPPPIAAFLTAKQEAK